MAKTSDAANYLGQLEDVLEEYLVKKAPALPENGKEALVKVLPWIIIIFMIPVIGLLLTAFGLSAMFAPFAMMGGYQSSAFSMVYIILALISVVVEIMALPGLFKRTEQGWRLAFYSSIISLVAGIFGGNLVSALLGALISFYILFQIKPMYK